MREDFAVFILSHGRAGNVITLKTLQDYGYRGKWYILLDNEDSQIESYKSLYGSEHIMVFDKAKESKESDTMDNFDGPNGVILFARNKCFDLAKSLGLRYFVEFDDDYNRFEYRWESNGRLLTKALDGCLDDIFEAMIDFLEDTNATTVAFAQGGDLIGGVNGGGFKKGILRKAMNSFFCRTDRPFDFRGRFNEDVNAYVGLGSQGGLFLTITMVDLVQKQTQANKGGMSESYNQFGTYVKSFYTVMANPSCVRINDMGVSNRRLHHVIDYECALPKIISSSYRKENN